MIIKSLPMEEILPAASIEKAHRLISAPDAMHGALRVLSAEEEAARTARGRAYQALKNIEEQIRLDGRGGRYDDALAAAQRFFEKADADWKRRTKAETAASAPWHKAKALSVRLVEWIDSHATGVMRGRLSLKSVPIKPEQAVDPLTAIEGVRRRYAEFDAEEARISAAPVPIEEIRERLVAAIDDLADRGAPQVDHRKRDGNPSDLDRKLMLSVVNGHTYGDAGAKFFVWLMRDEIVARLTDIAGKEDAPGAMTDAERKKALAALERKRLEHERREEAIILAAEARDIAIARRGDADPRAVLEVDIVRE